MLPNTIACTLTAVPHDGRDVVQPAIDLGAFGLPRAEHRADRAPELIVDVLREGLAPLLLDQALVFGDQRLQSAAVSSVSR